MQRLHHVPLGTGLLSLFQPCLVENQRFNSMDRVLCMQHAPLHCLRKHLLHSSSEAAMCAHQGFLELHNDAALSESSMTAVHVPQLDINMEVNMSWGGLASAVHSTSSSLFLHSLTIPWNSSSCYCPRTILTHVAPTSYVFPKVLYFFPFTLVLLKLGGSRSLKKSVF